MLWISCFIFFFPIFVTAFEIFWRLASRRLWPCRISSVDQFHPHRNTIELCLSNEVAHCYLCRKNGCWVWMWCWRPWKARHSYILVSMAGANGIRRFQRRHFAGRLLSYSCSYRKHLLYIHGFKRKHHLWGKSRWYKVLGPLFESCIVWQTPAVSKTLSEDKNEWPSRQVHLVSSWSLGHLLRRVLQRKLEIYGDFTCLPELSHRISITSGMLPLQVFTHQVDFFHPLKAVPTPSLPLQLHGCSGSSMCSGRGIVNISLTERTGIPLAQASDT